MLKTSKRQISHVGMRGFEIKEAKRLAYSKKMPHYLVIKGYAILIKSRHDFIQLSNPVSYAAVIWAVGQRYKRLEAFRDNPLTLIGNHYVI